VRKACGGLWKRQTQLVLHGSATQAAALDLESKFSEAALGPVQVTDYRNFAHGRHNWLAKRGDSTGVIALISNDDREIADHSLRLFPRDVPVARIHLHLSGEHAGIAALVAALHIVGQSGKAQGIDPGRPRVPLFGRRIYHLKVWPKRSSEAFLPSLNAIRRKAGVPSSQLLVQELDSWKRYYESFVHKIENARFPGIVFDFDGTLCSKNDRYTGINGEIGMYLERFLSTGITIGIATGRGKSVKQELRKRINKELWSSIVIGYYNGADIGLLGDDSHPNSNAIPADVLTTVTDAIRQDRVLSHLSDCTTRRMQITLEPKHTSYWRRVWTQLQQVVQQFGSTGILIVRSSHSMDVLAPGVSKKRLVEYVQHLVAHKSDSPVLCIGDLGRWPGNDFDLLSGPHSLSVDEVSISPSSCWNLAPSGHRGVQACLDYMHAIRVINSQLKLTVERIVSKSHR
jgi:hydroxymethylpyrimidine pyrophosphatase-like HAD family hydrolase